MLPSENFTYTVNETNSVTFVCVVVGNPASSISFYQNGRVIDESTNMRITLTDNSEPQDFLPSGGTALLVSRNLTLDNTMDTDSSTYTCAASNVAANVVPSILFPPVNFTYVVHETDPAIFICSATGIPPPEINWMRNGVPLDDNVDPHISLSNPSNPEVFSTTGGNIYSVSCNLTISNARDSDSDTYTCVASNENSRTPSVTQDFEQIVQGSITLFTFNFELFVNGKLDMCNNHDVLYMLHLNVGIKYYSRTTKLYFSHLSQLLPPSLSLWRT